MVIRTAVIDPTGLYRYRLDRVWAPLIPRRCCFVMLNPSTADASVDDPTIRRCVAFAKRWGYGSLTVVNLFGYRATCPAQLDMVDDPVGPENDRHILEALPQHPDERIVIAWGAQGDNWPDRVREVLRILEDARPVHLGLTKDGCPRHPLYVPADAVLGVY